MIALEKYNTVPFEVIVISITETIMLSIFLIYTSNSIINTFYYFLL